MPWIQIKLNATNENAEQIGDMLMDKKGMHLSQVEDITLTILCFIVASYTRTINLHIPRLIDLAQHALLYSLSPSSPPAWCHGLGLPLFKPQSPRSV